MTEFVPTREQRRQVCMMVHSGWDKKMMALDLRISTETLRLHFKDELKNGGALLEKYAKMAFAEKAMSSGSIPALKILAGHAAKKPKDSGDEGQKAQKPEPVGKKAQQKADAQDLARSGSVFSTPEPPARLNGNH